MYPRVVDAASQCLTQMLWNRMLLARQDLPLTTSAPMVIGIVMIVLLKDKKKKSNGDTGVINDYHKLYLQNRIE